MGTIRAHRALREVPVDQEDQEDQEAQVVREVQQEAAATIPVVKVKKQTRNF